MRQRIFCLSDEEANQLQAAYLYAQNANTKTRYQAVRLYGLGYRVCEILDICGGSHSRLLEWTRAYRDHGITALLDHRQGGNRAKVKPAQIETIQNQVNRYTPAQLLGKDSCQGDGQCWTSAALATLLQQNYEVTYQSPTSLRNLFQKIGFSYQRPSKQYKSHSDLKVCEFEEQLEKKFSISP